MAKGGIQKSFEKRLEALERSMKKKDDEIVELKSCLRSAEKNFADEIRAKDLVISDLYTKIIEVELKCSAAPTVENIHQRESTETDHVDESPDIAIPIEKVEHDLLILGDSLVRNLDSSAINPGGDTTIECVPGARPDGLVDKFIELSKTSSYKRIIVHGGTNLVPKFCRTTVADKIIESIESIRNLSPHSKVAFSGLLPKEGNHLLGGINEVNRRVEQAGLCGHFRSRYGFVHHARFFTNGRGEVDHRLFQRDGIHLNDVGSRALEKV